jgi:PPOX class probable F420-dependent enzyme
MLDLSQERDAHIDQRLRTELIIWLGTVRPDGRPHLVPVWYLWDGSTVLIFSQPHAQKVRNLRHSAQVVLALNTSEDGEDVVILEGTARLRPDRTVDSTLPAFVTKYDQAMADINTNPQKMAAEYSQAIEIVPKRFLPT